MQSGPPSLSFEYMEASHYPFGMHTVGGVFFRAISMMSEEKKSVLFLCFELLDSDCRKKRGGRSPVLCVLAGGSFMGITSSGSANMSNASKSGGSISFKDTAKGEAQRKKRISSYAWVPTLLQHRRHSPRCFHKIQTRGRSLTAAILTTLFRFGSSSKMSWRKATCTDGHHNSFKAVNPKRDQLLKVIRQMKRVWIRRAEDLG
jgi:hypothetical protein